VTVRAPTSETVATGRLAEAPPGRYVAAIGGAGLPREVVPEVVRTLRQQAHELKDNPADPTHPDAVRALRTMAQAARTLEHGGDALSDTLEERATAIERSGAKALHSGDVRVALVEAGDALRAQALADKANEAVLKRISVARTAAAAIDPSVPYLAERAGIEKAFVAVADAFVWTTAKPSAPPPVAVVEPPPPPSPFTRTRRLERWGYDQAGQQPDVRKLCDGGFSSVKIGRGASDVALAVLSLGWYTPAHVKAVCTGTPHAPQG
jgi:hypothetical protein